MSKTFPLLLWKICPATPSPPPHFHWRAITDVTLGHFLLRLLTNIGIWAGCFKVRCQGPRTMRLSQILTAPVNQQGGPPNTGVNCLCRPTLECANRRTGRQYTEVIPMCQTVCASDTKTKTKILYFKIFLQKTV